MSDDLPKRLRAACNGHPHATIPWPHRILHEAADRIEALTAENERLKGIFESANATASQRTVERDAVTRRIEALEAALRDVESKICSGNDHGAIDIIEAALSSEGTCEDYSQVRLPPRALGDDP